MNPSATNLDERTEKVVEMYSKYPFPFGGNHDNFFERFVLPTITQLNKDYPIRRLLEAGCGTGNITADIASRLPDVEITAVDLTDESLALARKRAESRGLKNVTFQKSNLLQHDPELGVFDFVYCQGVIHHLSDPLAGMKNLNRYLKKDCHAFVWLYSLLGKRRILEMREALKILGADDLAWEPKIQLAQKARPLFFSQRLTLVRKVIKILEYLDKNGFKGFGRYLSHNIRKSPQDLAGRIGLADQILHPQDKYYRFVEAIDLFTNAGFDFVSVLEGMSNSVDQSFGPDAPWINDKKLSLLNSYTLVELHEQPEGVGFLIKKIREI